MRSRVSEVFVTLAVTAAVLATPLGAQPGRALPREDPELYAAFFSFTDHFGGWLDARGAAAPANRAKLMQSAARYLRVDEADLPKLVAVSRAATAELRRIQAESRAYVEAETRNKRRPDVAVLEQFQSRRRTAVAAHVGQVRQGFSPAGWSRLQEYVNVDYRAGIHAQTGPTK
jgi:hypothetical protein